jgi:YD repeat-containing protein
MMPFAPPNQRPPRNPALPVDSSATATAYDVLGRVASKTDQAGKTTGYGHDSLGRLISVTQDVGGLNLVTSYGYDEVGNRVFCSQLVPHVVPESWTTESHIAGQTSKKQARFFPFR